MNADTTTDDGPRTAELAEQIVNAIQYPDERVHFINQALQLIPEDHPEADQIESTLRSARRNVKNDLYESDIQGDLRGAYGTLPLGPENVPEYVTDAGTCIDAMVQSEARKVLEADALLASVDRDRLVDEAAGAVEVARDGILQAMEPLAHQLAGLDADEA